MLKIFHLKYLTKITRNFMNEKKEQWDVHITYILHMKTTANKRNMGFWELTDTIYLEYFRHKKLD